MNDRVILFDFDGTLLNTSALFEKLVNEVLPQVTKKTSLEIKDLSDDYLASLVSRVDFHPDDYLSFISTHTQSNLQEINEAFYQPEFYIKAVFPEVREVISSLSASYPIGLFTQGIPSWQEKKLTLANLTDLFEPNFLYITKRKTTKQYLSKLPKPCIVIDDNIDIINALKLEPDVAPIFLDRNKEHNDPNSIDNLKEVLALV